MSGSSVWQTASALWTLSRPIGMLMVAILPLIGFAFGYWDHGCLDTPAHATTQLTTLALIWAIPHAGTMWLNAALDKDETATLFGRTAEVPPRTELFAYATLALSLTWAAFVEWRLMLAVLGCAILSVLYSNHRTAWKGHAVLGPLTNVIGYGVLSPLGGLLLAGFPFTWRTLSMLLVALPWIGTAYFAAQAFQAEDDRARGYRTLVALKGPRVTLLVTRGLFYAAVGATALLSALGWYPRIVFWSAPLFVWTDRVLAAWLEVPGGGDASWAKKYFLRLLVTGLVVVALVMIDYELALAHLGLPGGLATAAGHDEPRVCAALWYDAAR